MARDFLTAHEVGLMLGLAGAEAFHRQRPRLEDGFDFPMPMPQRLRPLLWRRDLVQAWIDGQGHARPAPAPAPRGPNVVLMRRAQTA